MTNTKIHISIDVQWVMDGHSGAIILVLYHEGKSPLLI